MGYISPHRGCQKPRQRSWRRSAAGVVRLVDGTCASDPIGSGLCPPQARAIESAHRVRAGRAALHRSSTGPRGSHLHKKGRLRVASWGQHLPRSRRLRTQVACWGGGRVPRGPDPPGQSGGGAPHSRTTPAGCARRSRAGAAGACPGTGSPPQNKPLNRFVTVPRKHAADSSVPHTVMMVLLAVKSGNRSCIRGVTACIIRAPTKLNRTNLYPAK
jgi:hypothetical protein